MSEAICHLYVSQLMPPRTVAALIDWWRKQIHGTMRYFGRGKSKDDLRSYKEAERRYLDFLAQLERTAPIEVPTNQVTVADAAEAYLQYLHDRVEVAANQSPKNAEQPKPDTSSFGGDDPQEREGLSATSWFRSSTSINLFVAHFPADKLINAVSALDLDSFRRAIESRRNKLAPKKSISKLKRTDAVRSAFARVQRSTGINGHRGFYSLRKTAASTIETINALVTSMFLAHSSREMKRHYALPNREALDAAVLELGKKLGIEGWPIHEGTCEATDLRRSSCHEETGQKAGQSGSAS